MTASTIWETTTRNNLCTPWYFAIFTIIYTAFLIFVTIKIDNSNSNSNRQDNDEFDILPIFLVIVFPSFLVGCFRVKEAIQKEECEKLRSWAFQIWAALLLVGVFIYTIRPKVNNNIRRDDNNDIDDFAWGDVLLLFLAILPSVFAWCLDLREAYQKGDLAKTVASFEEFDYSDDNDVDDIETNKSGAIFQRTKATIL